MWGGRFETKPAEIMEEINASISSFIPKPHTPFQWEAMNDRETIRAKHSYIRSFRKSGALKLKFHDVDVSYLEAVFSRGDRRLHRSLLKAREMGMRMDSWGELLDMNRWGEVFQETGVDPDWYALRERSTSEILPWDMIGMKIPAEHLAKEKTRAYAAMKTINQAFSSSPPPPRTGPGRPHLSR